MTIEEAIAAAREACIMNLRKGNLAYALSYIENIDKNRIAAKHVGQTRVEADVTQFAYILGNLSAWTGPVAREAKKTLHLFIKQHSK